MELSILTFLTFWWMINFKVYMVHIENTRNTVVASPKGLIAVIENNYQEDGSILIPKVLQPYMGGMEKLIVQK